MSSISLYLRITLLVALLGTLLCIPTTPVGLFILFIIDAILMGVIVALSLWDIN